MFSIPKRSPGNQISQSNSAPEQENINSSAVRVKNERTPESRLPSPRLRTAIIQHAIRNKEIKKKVFTFGNAINVDVGNLQERVKKSRAHNHAPLLAGAADTPPTKEYFEYFLEKVAEEFSAELEPASLNRIQKEGRIYKYCFEVDALEGNAPRYLKLLTPINNFFGTLKTLDAKKRKQGLNAVLMLPDNDLNCTRGMIERISFIENALSASNNFLDYIYAEAEERLIRSYPVTDPHLGNEVHNLLNVRETVLNYPELSDKKFLQEKTEKSINQFLEKEVPRVVQELIKIINSTSSLETKISAIKTCHEKYLPSLNWFFPPQHAGELSNTVVSQHSRELHQHGEYFELNDSYDDLINVDQVAIICDALKVAQPVLTSQSKISILKKNPAFWPILSKLFFPAVIEAHPRLSQTEFFDRVLYSHLLPELIDKGEKLSLLFLEKVLCLDKFFEKRSQEFSLAEKLILKNPSSAEFEVMYALAIESNSVDLVEKIESINGVGEAIKVVKKIKDLPPISAESIQVDLRAFSTEFTQLENPKVREIFAQRLLSQFSNFFNSLENIQKLEAVDSIKKVFSPDSFSKDLRVAVLNGLLKSIKPGRGWQQNMIHTNIVKLVGSQTEGMQTSKLGDAAIGVVLTLASTMGNLHAATLATSPAGVISGKLAKSQDPQTHAYKLIKRRLEQCAKDPQSTLQLVAALWRDETLHNLETSTRPLAAKHWKKLITSVVVNAALYAGTHVAPDVIGATIDAAQLSVSADIASADQFIAELAEKVDGYRDALRLTLENTKSLLNEIATNRPQLKALINRAYSYGVDYGFPGMDGLNRINGLIAHAKRYDYDPYEYIRLNINSLDTSSLSPDDKAVADVLKANLSEAQRIVVEGSQVLRELVTERFNLDHFPPHLPPEIFALEILHLQEIAQYSGAAVEGTYILGRKVPDIIKTAQKKVIGELATWGPVGGLRTVVTLGKAIHSKPLASIRHATIRLTPPTLINLRKATLPSIDYAQFEYMQELNTTWCAVLAQLNNDPSETGSTPVSGVRARASAAVADINNAAEVDLEANSQLAKNLPMADRLLILSSYIKEFTEANFPNVMPDDLALVKTHGLNQITTEQIRVLLPALYSHSKVAYLELALHLINNRSATPANLSQQEINDIARKLNNIAGTAGKMSRMRAKLIASKLRYTLVPAWLRVDFGLVSGRGLRTQAIKRARVEGLDAVVREQGRIVTAVEKLADANTTLAATQPAIDRQRINDSSAKFLAKWKTNQ